MSKQSLMILHDRGSSTGRLGAKLKTRGHELDIRCPLQGDELPTELNGYCSVMVFGGAMSANDEATLPGMRAELDWIETVLAQARPFVGICLGAQLIAKALGAEVKPHPDSTAEIGYFEVMPTTNGGELFEGPLNVYHWHKEGFDLPSDTHLLAEGERFPNQAYRYGEATYGFQFHPEVTYEIMSTWLNDAGESLSLPGAQAPEAHFAGHEKYDEILDRWVDNFLGHLLEDDAI